MSYLPDPAVIELADRLFDVVAGDHDAAPGPTQALEALMFVACSFARQCRASPDGVRRLFEQSWSLAVQCHPDFRVEVVSPVDLEAAIRESEPVIAEIKRRAG